MKFNGNYRMVGFTQHRIPYSNQVQQEFLMQEQHQQFQINQNQIIQYNNLLNQVLFVNEGKKTKREALKKSVKDQISFNNNSNQNDKSKSRSRISTIILEKEELEQCEKKINQEQQIKSYLLKDINQITKSMNLLKSDIGRIIQKTQSTGILQKKTNKTKVIVNDQLKKVSLALQKDYAEIYQANNLQIKFNTKLMNICNNEDLSLTKMKKHLGMIKQRQEYIYFKMYQRAKVMKNLNERQKLKEVIKIIRENNKLQMSELLNMIAFINDISKEQYQFLEIQSYQHYSTHLNGACFTPGKDIDLNINSQNIDKFLYLRMPSFRSKLKQIQLYLVKFITIISASLQKNNFLYEYNLNKSAQYGQKLRQLTVQKISKQDEIIHTPRYDKFNQEEYNLKYKQFKQKVKVIITFWCFISNNSIITKEINHRKQDEVITRKKTFNNKARVKRQSSQLVVSAYFNQDQNYYMNQLYNLTLYLGNLLQDYELEQQFLLQEVQNYISSWLKGLKEVIIKSKGQRRYRRFDSNHIFKSTQQLVRQQTRRRISNPHKYRLSSCNSQIVTDKFKLILNVFNNKRSQFGNQLQRDQQQDNSQRKKNHQNQCIKTQDNQCSPTQRVNYIKKIEKQHHQLMKNVLKCEKQNNMKDYTFKKQFTRKKWTEKSLVQEEKRFQANFTFEVKNGKGNNTLSSQSFGQNRLKVLNQQQLNSTSQNSAYRTTSKTSKHPFGSKTNSISRFSTMNEDDCNVMVHNPKSIFNANKLSKKSIMVQKTLEQDQDYITSKLPTKISFVDVDNREFQ